MLPRCTIVLSLLFACGSPSLGISGADPDACPRPDPIEVGRDDTPHGFSANEVVARANDRPATLTWTPDGPSTAFDLVFEWTGDPVEADDPDFDPDLPPGAVCPGPPPTQLRVPVHVSFTSADGAFDERVASVLGARGRPDGSGFDLESVALTELDIGGLEGTYQPPPGVAGPITLDLFGWFGAPLDVVDDDGRVIGNGNGTLWGRTPTGGSEPAECDAAADDVCSFLIATYRYDP